MHDTYTLFGTQGCGSTIVAAALALTAFPWGYEEVDYTQDGPERDRLLALNPLGQVPTLVLPNDEVMTESAAIILLLHDRAPHAELAPPGGSPLLPRFLRWLLFINAEIYPTFTYADHPQRWQPQAAGAEQLKNAVMDYRERLLQQLNATAAAAGWQHEPPSGVYRGMACNIWVGRNNAFTTYVGLVVEIAIQGGRLRVLRAVCAIDCGKVINPNLVRANVEGGIGFALTTCLHCELHFERGGVVEGNFDRYPLLAIAEMPKVEVVILDSARAPQGCGEVSTAVVAPAIASALHKATGKTYRTMPFPREFSSV